MNGSEPKLNSDSNVSEKYAERKSEVAKSVFNAIKLAKQEATISIKGRTVISSNQCPWRIGLTGWPVAGPALI